MSSHPVTYTRFKIAEGPDAGHLLAMEVDDRGLVYAAPDIVMDYGVRIFESVEFESNGEMLVASFPSPRPFRLLRQMTRKGWRPKI